MPKLDTHQRLLPSVRTAQLTINELMRRRGYWFEVEPWPSGRYAIRVKIENGGALDDIVNDALKS